MKANHSAIFITLAIAGCGGAPGSPLLRTSLRDGEGPLAEDCKNVSSRTQVEDYITGCYLSTWGSAWAEGATQGFTEALSGSAGAGSRTSAGLRARGLMSPAVRQSMQVHALPVPPSPYCRVYAAEAAQVSRAVALVVPLLGDPIHTSDEASGAFATEPVQRQFQPNRCGSSNQLLFKEGARGTRWRDSYQITVTDEGRKRTVVRIWRYLYISRRGGPFSQAVSSGHNEAWIMTQIAKKLNERGRQSR